MTDDEFQKHVEAFFQDYIDHIYMNYINPDPEQKTTEIDMDKQNLQQLETEILKLREQIAMMTEAMREIRSIIQPYEP